MTKAVVFCGFRITIQDLDRAFLSSCSAEKDTLLKQIFDKYLIITDEEIYFADDNKRFICDNLNCGTLINSSLNYIDERDFIDLFQTIFPWASAEEDTDKYQFNTYLVLIED